MHTIIGLCTYTVKARSFAKIEFDNSIHDFINIKLSGFKCADSDSLAKRISVQRVYNYTVTCILLMIPPKLDYCEFSVAKGTALLVFVCDKWLKSGQYRGVVRRARPSLTSTFRCIIISHFWILG